MTNHIYVGTSKIASIDGDGVLTYNHEDHLGSSSLRTDSSGNVVKNIVYSPFGNKRLESGSYNKIPYRFTGQYEDAESGLHYYRKRYYDSTLSRFVSADPLYLEEMDARGVDTQSLNLFAYVGNAPLMMVDPEGEFACGGLCLAALTGVALGARSLSQMYRMTVATEHIDANKGRIESIDIANRTPMHQAALKDLDQLRVDVMKKGAMESYQSIANPVDRLGGDWGVVLSSIGDIVTGQKYDKEILMSDRIMNNIGLSPEQEPDSFSDNSSTLKVPESAQ